MKPLRIHKGRNVLLLDRNRSEGYLSLTLDGGGVAVFLDADELGALGSAATALSRELKREEAYAAAKECER